ncbi:hypothetical protein AGDE_15142 [Angomonas deanei]|uniref:Uncharacterized protein n=1 Tax=Angomonas deanei TaxID=59799 RepID=A0A7G2CP95_9TRYP|nr:hypothetical protein AGDE_15142 [Angomonas deanei]CAD2220373.1 hypothetical protein, conserved [Angomonas deanei]|eukprot:EPY19631.1 hypothetical protein AGDE_15142 [Angomonas deanei]
MNGHNHSNRNSISRKQIRELQEMPASARGQRISELKKRGEPVPDLEEGVDENDNAQDISIDDLKARIKRELEEYRKNGPLMLRRKSANVRRAPRKMTAHQTPKRPPVAERPTPGASPAPRKPSGMSPSRKPSLNAPAKRNQNIKSNRPLAAAGARQQTGTTAAGGPVRGAPRGEGRTGPCMGATV